MAYELPLGCPRPFPLPPSLPILPPLSLARSSSLLGYLNSIRPLRRSGSSSSFTSYGDPTLAAPLDSIPLSLSSVAATRSTCRRCPSDVSPVGRKLASSRRRDRFRRKDLPSSEHRSPNKGIVDYPREADLIETDSPRGAISLAPPEDSDVAADSAVRAGSHGSRVRGTNTVVSSIDSTDFDTTNLLFR